MNNWQCLKLRKWYRRLALAQKLVSHLIKECHQQFCCVNFVTNPSPLAADFSDTRIVFTPWRDCHMCALFVVKGLMKKRTMKDIWTCITTSELTSVLTVQVVGFTRIALESTFVLGAVKNKLIHDPKPHKNEITFVGRFGQDLLIFKHLKWWWWIYIWRGVGHFCNNSHLKIRWEIICVIPILSDCVVSNFLFCCSEFISLLSMILLKQKCRHGNLQSVVSSFLKVLN